MLLQDGLSYVNTMETNKPFLENETLLILVNIEQSNGIFITPPLQQICKQVNLPKISFYCQEYGFLVC